jgi:UDP-3-O-[3-hydroxymyristoyl] glucosamine N-acyltransferase
MNTTPVFYIPHADTFHFAFRNEGQRRSWRSQITVKKDDTVSINNTFDFGDGPVKAHQHVNGGGWVADTATVADTVFVSPSARVWGHAQVIGRAKLDGRSRVRDRAKVSGRARLQGEALIEDRAHVTGDSEVYQSGLVELAETPWSQEGRKYLKTGR